MPKKPIPDMTYDELFDAAQEGAEAQQTALDQLWYSVNLNALEQSLTTARFRTQDVTDLLDEVPEDEQERADAIADYKERNWRDLLSDEEKNRLEVPVSEAAKKNLSQLSSGYMKALKDSLFQINSYEDAVNAYRLLGMLHAKIAVDLGKEYEENLKTLPADEENREQKAFYLQSMDTDSKANLRAKGFKDLQNTIAEAVYRKTGTRKILDSSPLKDLASLKKMNLRQFFDAAYTSAKDRKITIENAAKNGMIISEETNAYEYFKTLVLERERGRKESNPQYQMQTGDDEILLTATERFKRDLMQNAQMFGTKMIRESLDKKDKKRLDNGEKLNTTFEYKAPKPIRDWAKNQGDPMIRARRIDRMNETYADVAETLDRRKPYDLEKEAPYKRAFGNHLKPDAPDYDCFVQDHISPKAVMSGREEMRSHLALVMAANAVHAGTPGPLHREAVLSVAETYMNRAAFRMMSDKEVAEALLSRKNVLKAQRKIIKATFGVPENKRGDYIRKMQELSQSMVPMNGQSEKYQAMFKSVKAIGELDPNDPDLENKLIAANSSLLVNVTEYTKGKKSLRSFRSSQARFDNSIDVLSVANDHVPGLKQYAKEIVDRTNEVRKTHAGDADFVSLSDYGTERARRHAPANAAVHQEKKIPDLKAPKIGL